jgi:hypothetical protein
MHINLIDAPSDIYGAVSSVSRPLVHALNEATMHRSTYDALAALLAWAAPQMDAVRDALDEHSQLEAEQHQRDKSPVQREETPAEETPAVSTASTPESITPVIEMSIKPLVKRAPNKPKS